MRSRRGPSAILLGAMVLLLSGCLWPQARFGPSNGGFNPFEYWIGSGNVGSLAPAFTAPAGWSPLAPVVARNSLYVGAAGGLKTFDARGTLGCAGVPKICTPLWTATGLSGKPVATANDILFTLSGNQLLAFDANGVTGCGGAPKTCTPLWAGSLGLGEGRSLSLADGVVYVIVVTSFGGGGETDALLAFDAAGSTGCGGTPKVCTRLWTGGVGGGFAGAGVGGPAVANGRVFATYTRPGVSVVEAFDAAGVTGCSGSPKSCSPLWTGNTGGGSVPAIADGIVYVGGSPTALPAFDAAGINGCSGTPTTCTPLWTLTDASGLTSPPALANGVAYVGTFAGGLLAFDAKGVNGCSGSPKTCAPLWHATVGSGLANPPSVANGVVYASANDGSIRAFDAAGVSGCSGSPKTCSSLWSTMLGAVPGSPIVARGTVYIPTADGNVRAYRLPPS